MHADVCFGVKWSLGCSLRRWKPTGLRGRGIVCGREWHFGTHDAPVAACRSLGKQELDWRRASLANKLTDHGFLELYIHLQILVTFHIVYAISAIILNRDFILSMMKVIVCDALIIISFCNNCRKEMISYMIMI